MMNISIIGLGYIGTVIGAVLSSQGNNVTAIDVDEDAINLLNKGITNIPEPTLRSLVNSSVEAGLLSGRTDYSCLSESEVILITVGTPLSENFDADLSDIRSVFSSLSKNIKDGQVIMVKSTVPPGVTRMMAEEFLTKNNVYIGFSPERLAEGNAIDEFKKLPIVVGGINEESTRKCAEFWENSLGVDVIRVSSPEAAELVKLADNQWIDLNIALANELAILCDSMPYDLDILEIISGANSLKKGEHYVNILTPSIGVGGDCLTKDPWFLDSLAKKNNCNISLPSAGRLSNDFMPNYVAQRIDSFLSKTSVIKEDLKIAILGYSFKNNSGDIRFTPMEKFIESIVDLGYKNISVFDSMIHKGSVSNKKAAQIDNWQECVEGAHCVVFGAAHDDIASIPIESLTNLMFEEGLIYDGRIYFDKNKINELRSLGISYQGVGRTI